jgi:hypothetical protein
VTDPRRGLEVKMLQKLLVAFLMAGLTVVAAADTVYKWADSRGQVHYTDLPPTQSDAKVLGIYHQESSIMDEEEGDEESDNGEEPSTVPSDDGSGEPAASGDTVASVEADVAIARVKQCKEARIRYQKYVESRRLFRETPDGKRQYLTDQELAQARVRAKQSVDEFCS